MPLTKDLTFWYDYMYYCTYNIWTTVWRNVSSDICTKRSLRSLNASAQSDKSLRWHSITKTRLFKYIENFTTKNWKFSDKNSDNFQISAQNIDCGYSLEPPRRGGSNEYPQSMCSNRKKKNNVYACKPQYYYIKVGLKGVKIIWACFRDALDSQWSKVSSDGQQNILIRCHVREQIF